MILIDVADLAWSPCKQYLASCGFDSKVCVWAANSFERITTIEQHTGFVKGVTWDPAGQYLATQSDDLSVKIFRVSDWRVEKDIVKPFVGVTSTTFFRRLSWSPDGAAVCTVNGESGGCGVAPILYRQDWQSAVVLVGHEAPVEVASFNPHLFKHDDEANGKRVDTAVVALGSQDCGISVWWSGGARAICCAQQIFEGSVMDMAWTADGMGLLSCSYDGTICYMEFDESEFGTLTSKSDLDKTLNKYGNHGTKNLIPESADTIRIEKMFAEKGAQMLANRLGQGSETSVGFGTVNTQHEDTSSQPLQAPSIVPAQPVTPTRVPIASAEKQHESVTKDGKRRIRPVLIESNRSSLPDPVVTQSSQSANPIGVKKARMDLSANTLPMESSGVQYQLPVVVVQESHSNLQIPARRSVFSIDYTCKITDRHDTIEFKNTTSSCSIIATQGGEIVWTMVYKSPCLLATRGSTFLALAFADCTLQLVTTQAGQMILPPIKTLSAISILVAVDQYLLYIDCIGSLKLLNVEEMNPKLTTTILGLFKDNTSISSVNIHETGEPIITTTANESFLFSLKLQSWLQITLTSNHFEKIPRSLPKLDQIEVFIYN